MYRVFCIYFLFQHTKPYLPNRNPVEMTTTVDIVATAIQSTEVRAREMELPSLQILVLSQTLGNTGGRIHKRDQAQVEPKTSSNLVQTAVNTS